jgi:hypothetical protein
LKNVQLQPFETFSDHLFLCFHLFSPATFSETFSRQSAPFLATLRNVTKRYETLRNLTKRLKPYKTFANLSKPFKTFQNLSKPFKTFPLQNLSNLLYTPPALRALPPHAAANDGRGGK